MSLPKTDPRHGDKTYDVSPKDIPLIARECDVSTNYVHMVLRSRERYNEDIVWYAEALLKLRQQFADHKAAKEALKNQPTAQS